MSKNKITWHTEKRKLNHLKGYEFNPRSLSEAEYADLKKSLEKFDLAEIPAINTNNIIVAGHQRIKILSELYGVEHSIEVRVPNRKLTDKEYQEYNIRSNKNTGSWDFDILANNFEYDDLINWGFKEKELDPDLWNEKTIEELDEIPEIEKTAISKRSDLFLIDGKHKILCGDSNEEDDAKLLMDGNKGRLLFTSPSYNMNGGRYKGYKDNRDSEDFIKFNIEVAKNYLKYLKGFLFWNISYNKNARNEFIEILHRLSYGMGLQFLDLIIWDKGNGTPIESDEMLSRYFEEIGLFETDGLKDIEIFVSARNERTYKYNKKNRKVLSNYWKIPRQNKQEKTHKAVFPIMLPSKAIWITTEENQIVIDPFLGSGSTLIACEQTNRICYGMEIDPIYIDLILKRYHKLYPEKKIQCLTRKDFNFKKLFNS